MSTTQRDERLRLANEILPLVAGSVRLERIKGRLWIVHEGQHPHRAAAVLSRCGLSLACDYQHLGMGSTRAGATAMLIRFVRDLPRPSADRWEKHFGSAIVGKLRAAGYDDPTKTGCVFCGSPEIEDWWSHGECKGPCCSGYLGCKLKHAAKVEVSR